MTATSFYERHKDLIDSITHRHANGQCGKVDHLCQYCRQPVNVLESLDLDGDVGQWGGCEFFHKDCLSNHSLEEMALEAVLVGEPLPADGWGYPAALDRWQRGDDWVDDFLNARD